MTRKITIIHPSRERSELCYKTSDLFYNNCINKDNISYYISIDLSDPTRNDYLSKKRFYTKLIMGPNNSCIEAVNLGAKESNFEDIIVVVSDDFICNYGWDQKIIDFVGNKKNFVLKTNDGREPWIVTLPILDKDYYLRFGYVYNPLYQHLFCDTEMTHVAEITGSMLVDMSNLIEHKTTELTHNDCVNIKNNSTWWQGESVYLQRLKENFGLKKEEIIKSLSGASHIEWLKQKGINIETTQDNL